MAPGRKMILIPFDMFNQQVKQADITPLVRPIEHQLVKSVSKMTDLLNDQSLTDDVKSKRVQQAQLDTSILADKVMQEKAQQSPPVEPPPCPLPAVMAGFQIISQKRFAVLLSIY